MSCGLCTLACVTATDVILNEGVHARPVEEPADSSICAVEAKVSGSGCIMKVLEELSSQLDVVGDTDPSVVVMSSTKELLGGEKIGCVAADKFGWRSRVGYQGPVKSLKIGIVLVSRGEKLKNGGIEFRDRSNARDGGGGDIWTTGKGVGNDIGVARFVLEGDVEVGKEVTPPEDSSRWLGLGED